MVRVNHELAMRSLSPLSRADPSMIMEKFLWLVTRTLSTIIPGICICICSSMIQKLHLQGHLFFVTKLKVKATKSEFSFFVNCEIVSPAEDACQNWIWIAFHPKKLMLTIFGQLHTAQNNKHCCKCRCKSWGSESEGSIAPDDIPVVKRNKIRLWHPQCAWLENCILVVNWKRTSLSHFLRLEGCPESMMTTCPSSPLDPNWIFVDL